MTKAKRWQVPAGGEGLFWLDDLQWSVIEKHLPTNSPGPRPKRNREVISGIVHVLRSGCRWKDCPRVYGPPTTVYNRFHRWAKRGVWQKMFAALASVVGTHYENSIDSTIVKAHRSAAGRKGGPGAKPSAARAAGARPRSTPSPTPRAAR